MSVDIDESANALASGVDLSGSALEKLAAMLLDIEKRQASKSDTKLPVNKC